MLLVKAAAASSAVVFAPKSGLEVVDIAAGEVFKAFKRLECVVVEREAMRRFICCTGHLCQSQDASTEAEPGR
jgi:hypothetical protein